MAKKGFGSFLKSVLSAISSPSISEIVQRDQLLYSILAQHKAKQWQPALDDIRRYLELAPQQESIVAWIRCSCCLQLGLEEEARSLYTADDADPNTRFVAAQFLKIAERYSEALPLWKSLLRDHEQKAFCQTSVMLCLIGSGALEQAKGYYEPEKTTSEDLQLAADWLWSLQHYAEAVKLYTRALARQDPYVDKNRPALVTGRLRGLEGQGKFDEVVATFKREDTPLGSRLRCAERLTHTWDQPAAGLEAWTVLASADDPEIRLAAQEGRVHCLVKLGRHAEAEALWRQPGVDHRLITAASRLYSEAGDSEHGIPVFDYLREVAPEFFHPATRNLIELLGQARDINRLQALAADPSTPLDCKYQIAIKFQTHDLPDGIVLYQQIAETTPHDDPKALFAVMMANNKIGREETALKVLRDNPPLHAIGYRAMGDFHDCNGNYDLAGELYAEGLDRGHPDLHYLSGYLRNRVCVGEWDRVPAVRDMLARRIEADEELQEPGKARWRLYLDLVDGRFQEAWDRAAAMKAPARQPMALKVRYQDVRVVTSALLGKIAEFDRLAEEYSANPDRWERPAMLAKIMVSLAQRYGKTAPPACIEKLTQMPI